MRLSVCVCVRRLNFEKKTHWNVGTRLVHQNEGKNTAHRISMSQSKSKHFFHSFRLRFTTNEWYVRIWFLGHCTFVRRENCPHTLAHMNSHSRKTQNEIQHVQHVYNRNRKKRSYACAQALHILQTHMRAALSSNSSANIYFCLPFASFIVLKWKKNLCVFRTFLISKSYTEILRVSVFLIRIKAGMTFYLSFFYICFFLFTF